MIRFEDGKLQRKIVNVDNKKEIVNIEEKYNELYKRTFGEGDYCANKNTRNIIYVNTLFQDYKKLSCDLFETMRQKEGKIFYINADTGIDSMCKKRNLFRFARKANLIKYSLSEISCVVSLAISIFDFFLNILNVTSVYHRVIPYIFLALGGILILYTKRARRQQYHEIMTQMETIDIDKLINIFRSTGIPRLRFSEKNLILVENLQEVSPSLRALFMHYLGCESDYSQLWCIFDTDEKDSNLINKEKIKGNLKKYKLIPVSLQEKKEIYRKLGMDLELREYYIGLIGIDRMFIEELGFISRDYPEGVKERIERLYMSGEYGRNYIRAFYCVVYLGAKLGYFLTIHEMVQLLISEGRNNQEFMMLEKNCKEDIGADQLSPAKLEEFLNKIIDKLREYCFFENKHYRFSTNILNCLQKDFEEILPDVNTTKRWVLVKLVCNPDLFQEENYFLDCSDLLEKVDFRDEAIAVTLAIRLLDMMNKSYCWFYCPLILQYLDKLTDQGDVRSLYIDSEIVREVIINCRVLIADYHSVCMHYNFLQEHSEFFSDIGQEIVPFSITELMDMEIEEKETFYYQLMRENDPTAYIFYYLRELQMLIYEQEYYNENRREVREISFLDPLNIPVKIVITFFLILLEKRLGNDREKVKHYCTELYAITNILHSSKNYPSRILENILREFIALIQPGNEQNQEDADFRHLFLSAAIENTNSEMLRFLYDVFFISQKNIGQFTLKNDELTLLHQLDFYVHNPFSYGITNYIEWVIDSKFDINIRIQILLLLGFFRLPNYDAVRGFFLENQNCVLNHVKGCLEQISEAKDLEYELLMMIILNSRMKSEEFTVKLIELSETYISECLKSQSEILTQVFQYILLREKSGHNWTDQEVVEIANSLNLHELALYFFEAKYYEDPQIILFLPEFKWLLQEEYNTTIIINMVLLYLEVCKIYKISMKYLFYSIHYMEKKPNVNRDTIERFLHVIDRFEQNGVKIKRRIMETYTYYQSKLFLLESVYINENINTKIVESNLLVLTYKILCILAQRINFFADKKNISRLLWEERSPEMDDYVLENIMIKKAIIYSGETLLNKEFYIMITYLVKNNDVYTILIERNGRNRVELILNKSLIQLLEIYINTIDKELLPETLAYLSESKRLLEECSYALLNYKDELE